MADSTRRDLVVSPIGYVRTAKATKYETPSQPDPRSEEVNWIDLLAGCQYEMALEDLDGFSHVWLLFWFDRNEHWRPRVMPPRGPAKRRGVFATRSPHRPNPLGLTSVRLLKVEGLTLSVGPLDLLDGTPILDIKPYLHTVDCHPDSGLGWLEEVVAEEQQPPTYQIVMSKDAQTQIDWLRAEWQIDFTQSAFEKLRRDPTPHRTRRILQVEPGLFRIACGAWRMYYHIERENVIICDIAKGFSDETLQSHLGQPMPDREAQLAFAAWKESR